jgi:hypothetical protein
VISRPVPSTRVGQRRMPGRRSRLPAVGGERAGRARLLSVTSMLVLVTACSGADPAPSSGPERAGFVCPRETTPQVDQFVTLWSAALLAPDFQRRLVAARELPGAPQVPGLEEPTASQQRVLSACLADRMAELRDQGLGQDSPFAEVDGGENVYAEAFISVTGTPYTADLLRELIFNREALEFDERAGGLPVQPQPPVPRVPVLQVPPPPG